MARFIINIVKKRFSSNEIIKPIDYIILNSLYINKEAVLNSLSNKEVIRVLNIQIRPKSKGVNIY